jgi:sterol desaturase/sphingolipid hydroxylase (fatty acid hydroxylase superfamily)
MMLLHQIVGIMGGRMWAAFWLFLLVLGIEQLLPVERILDGPGLFLNCAAGFFYFFAGSLASLVASSLLLHVPLGRISAFAVTDGGDIAKALALSFGSLAVRDFFYYWFHRLQHGSKWLWAEHALHHTDEHMNITTSVRHHWLEMPLEALFVDIPLVLLFRPPIITLGIVAWALSMVATTNHMNFRFGLGRFGWLIATPQLHRIHHSAAEEHFDKNFAAFFPLWDVVFGTYYAPRKGEYPATGLASGERVRTIGQALVLPFIMWRKLWRARSAPSLPVPAEVARVSVSAD